MPDFIQTINPPFVFYCYQPGFCDCSEKQILPTRRPCSAEAHRGGRRRDGTYQNSRVRRFLSHSSLFCLLSSVLCHLSSVFCPLSSVFCQLSFMAWNLGFACPPAREFGICYPTSFLYLILFGASSPTLFLWFSTYSL